MLSVEANATSLINGRQSVLSSAACANIFVFRSCSEGGNALPGDVYEKVMSEGL